MIKYYDTNNIIDGVYYLIEYYTNQINQLNDTK